MSLIDWGKVRGMIAKAFEELLDDANNPKINSNDYSFWSSRLIKSEVRKSLDEIIHKQVKLEFQNEENWNRRSVAEEITNITSNEDFIDGLVDKLNKKQLRGSK